MSRTTTLDAVPSLSGLYGKAAVSTVLPNTSDRLPDHTLELPDLAIDRDHLTAYQRVCGFRQSDRLPATYLHVASFPLAVALMAQRRFPFSLLGLVHVGNRITQHAPLTATDRPTLRVETAALRAHPKGQQFDVVATATVAGETIWDDVSTYLRRGAGDERGDTPGPDETLPPQDDASQWDVPADIGRRYGAVSGDRNPIHLHPLTAKLFGFPRNIAHGMWTKARCLADLEGRLDDRYTVDVAFKKPLVLPATVRFSATDTDDGWRIAVHATDGSAPHLAGELLERPAA